MDYTDFNDNSVIGDYPHLVSSLKLPSEKNLSRPVNSGVSIRWKCVNCQNVWTEAIPSRRRYNHCPSCQPRTKIARNVQACLKAGKKTIKLCGECEVCYNRSFASVDKSAFWSKKNDIDPKFVLKGSDKRYLFLCSCGHEFESILGSITKGNWCSFCSGALCKNDDCKDCYNKSFASDPKAKFWSTKNVISPRHVTRGTPTKYWFDCDCGHSFEMTINNLNSIKKTPVWCSYCTGWARKMCEDKDCKSCFEKSFATVDKSKYWSNRNVEKDPITGEDIFIEPSRVFKTSHIKRYFNCECGHEIYICPGNIVTLGNWCSFCSKGSEALCKDLTCDFCHNKSFLSHERACFWSKRNTITLEDGKVIPISPRFVNKGSTKKYWFDCDCGHSFETKLSNIGMRDTWCKYCCNGSRFLCDDKDCQPCYDKSFASSERAKNWSSSNVKDGVYVSPRDVFKCSGDEYFFDCHECGLTFKSSPHNVKRSWCPVCVNKTELKLYEFLKPLYDVIREKTFDWCRSSTSFYRYDFYVSSLDIILELDGEQHFTQVSNWGDPNITRSRDVYKMRCALEHGITVIRILQEDVYYDRYDWKSILSEALYKRETPVVEYKDSEGRYVMHIQDMESSIKDEESKEEET